MKYKHLFIWTLTICIGITGCTQTNRYSLTKNYIMPTDSTLTPDNYVTKMLEHVRHYPVEPFYYLHVANILCSYEILVNDFPVYKYYKEGQMISPIDINWAINKSGPQTITCKLYPSPDSVQGHVLTELPESAAMEIRLYKRNLAIDTAFETEEKVGLHQSATKPDGSFIASGQKYYEYKFTFTAQVPYENKGWSESEDLRKINQDTLLVNAVEAYRQVRGVKQKV